LPSRDSESLTRDEGVDSSRSGHEAGWLALDLIHGQIFDMIRNRTYLQRKSTEGRLVR
jgi:hypothetical protein